MEKGSGTHINGEELIPEYVKNAYILMGRGRGLKSEK